MSKVSLPKVPKAYDADAMQRLVAQIEGHLGKCVMVGDTITAGGNVTLKIKSPDGTDWTASAENTGNLDLTS